MKESVKKHWENNREAHKEYLRKNYYKNRMDEEYVKKSRLTSKEYYDNNREAVIKRVRAQQEKNKMNDFSCYSDESLYKLRNLWN